VRALAGLLVLSIGFLSAPPVSAQERPWSVYVIAGATAVHQSGADDGQSQIYITAPGGTVPGLTVAAGVFVAARVSIEGECSTTRILSAREPARYGMTYIEERRDRLFGALIRVHTRPGRRVDIEPVVGVAAARHDRWSQTLTVRSWLPAGQATDVGPRIRYQTLTGLAVTGGVDLRIGGRHFALVPSLRARLGTRGEEIEAYYPGGYPRWAVVAGMSARVDF
jgi:hypothetical protein